MINTNWEVQKCALSCSKCETEFKDAEQLRTVLYFNQDNSVERKDFCANCFSAELKTKDSISWKVTFKAKKKEGEVQDKKAIVEELFKEYLHSSEPVHSKYCYIMALMLERKKILVEKKDKKITSKSSGRRMFFYEHAKSGEVFIVHDPDIDLFEISSLQREITDILDKKGLREVL